MTSALRPAAQMARAISIARSVLPVAVGPPTTIRGGATRRGTSSEDADVALPSPAYASTPRRLYGPAPTI